MAARNSFNSAVKFLVSWGRPPWLASAGRSCQAAGARPADALDGTHRYWGLTAPERQVYQLLAEGNSNKELANRLNLSLHTVETHRWRIMEKMDLHSTAELVLSAVRRGLVT